MDDTIGGDNVLLQHHLDTVDCEAVPITANLNVVTLQGLVGGTGHDGLRALDRVQEVEIQQGWRRSKVAFKWDFKGYEDIGFIVYAFKSSAASLECTVGANLCYLLWIIFGLI